MEAISSAYASGVAIAGGETRSLMSNLVLEVWNWTNVGRAASTFVQDDYLVRASISSTTL